MNDEVLTAQFADLLESIRDGTAKAEAKAAVSPEWWEQYGEAAWRASLVQLGLPEDYDLRTPAQGT